MTPEFKVRDRIRLKPGSRHEGLLPGDTGTVVAVLPPTAAEQPPLYRVRMNRTTAGMYATLRADEVEFMQ
jgi:hypothetical protein